MITIVFGPPGAGKTTYVQERISPGDVTIDFDLLFQALTGLPAHNNEARLWGVVNDIREFVEAQVDQYPDVRNWWIVRTRMSSNDMRAWELMGAKILKLDPGKSEVLRRMARDTARPEWEQWIPIVERWYEDYGERAKGDGG